MFNRIEKMLDREPEFDEAQAALDAEPFMAQYRTKVGLTALSILLALVSLGVFYIVAKKVKPPELYFISTAGQLDKIQVDMYPNQSQEAVKDWAREAMQKSFTLDFLSLDNALASAEPYFTQDAWPVFYQTTQSSPLVKEIMKNKVSSSIVAKTDPIIESSALVNGTEFAWRLIIPATMSFSGDAATKTQDVVIRITVVRVPTTENPKGLGVLQMTTR